MRGLVHTRISRPTDRPLWLYSNTLFYFIGYGFYNIVHFCQFIQYFIGVILFYHRNMKVNSRRSIFRMFIKFTTRKRF